MTAAATELYLQVRQKEGRLYPDDVVAQLPYVVANHPLKKEWEARRASMKKVARYVAGLPRSVRLMELGCGNGWLSHHLAALPDVHVWGLDRSSSELAQAARVFGSANLAFAAADIFAPPFARDSFDIILIASAIQYFPDLARLITQLCGLLQPKGEIHIIDSPLYQEAEVEAARERTKAYYAALGSPEMAAYYFHHTYGELHEFMPRVLYRPDSVQARLAKSLGRVDSPFPWICIGRDG